MKKLVFCVIFLAGITCLTACNSHEHNFSEPDCENAAICAKCGESEGEPLGHTTNIGVCSRCDEVQNEELLGFINTEFAEVMDEGTKLIGCVSEIAGLSNNAKYDAFLSADTYTENIQNKLCEIIEECSSESELNRLVYQTNLLVNACPTKITGSDAVSLANQTIFYQLFFQQLSSSFNYLSEDMAYLAGNISKPNSVAYFDEANEMPKPDSVIYGISYDSEKTESGVKQYIYLIGDNESDANLNYNIYLSAIDMAENLEIEIEESCATVTKDGNMVSAMMAGTDPVKGFFLIVTFQE